MKKLIILLGVLSIQCINVIEYFVYYYPSKEALVCSNTKENDGTGVANQFQIGNGVTCLVSMNEDGVYNFNLLLASINEEDNYKRPPLIDVNIATQNIYKQIDISSEKVVKIITLKKDSTRLFYSIDCIDISMCKFTEIPKALIENRLLKLNFILKRMKVSSKILLQTFNENWKPFDIDQHCEDDCEYGVCEKGDCLCLSGYYGDDCSKGIYLLY
jgi:hypothetical protein